MNHFIGTQNPMHAQMKAFANFHAQHFVWTHDQGVGIVTLNEPDKKNPLTFDSYAELRDLFSNLRFATDIKVVLIQGAQGNFCSGGDVHDIIGPLTHMSMPELLSFTRMTGDLVKTMRLAPQPIISAIDGVCAGAGAMIALASDMRLASEQAKTAFLFTRVGLAGADMGACALLPRVIGQGRATELLMTGRALLAQEGLNWGFYNQVCESKDLYEKALALAHQLATGPTFAHAMTKNMLHQEWSMGLEQAIEAEAQAQAICMQTQDFERAYRAFVQKQKPVFCGD
jgi:enoyl-CoA hydratase/carnithine racemase